MNAAANNSDGEHIAIIGGGLAGPLLACFLARKGFTITLYERRNDPRTRGYVGGRSINLALSARGIDALQRVGLADKVLAGAIPMRGRMVHPPPHGGRVVEQDLALQYYSSNHTDAINSVSRGQLNCLLLDAAEAHPNVRIVFDHRCTAVNLDMLAMTFEKPDGSTNVVTDCTRIIGCDGAFSALRLAMMLRMDRFEYQQHYLEHGYKELHIPPAKDCGVDPAKHDGFAMDPNALHIWPRRSRMMIALPNQDRSFTCTLFWPLTGPGGLETFRTEQDIIDHFREHYPDAVPLMPTLVEDFQRNPVGSLVTVRCWPWWFRDKAVLLGDAAHAIVPFYGQGMNAAFEDCVALEQALDRHAGNWAQVFETYSRQRKPNAEAIADMALHNFIEMRDLVAKRSFRFRKKVEHRLHAMFPQAFLPLYNMVSFSTIPYADARNRARIQDRWMILGLIALAMLAIALIVTVIVMLT